MKVVFHIITTKITNTNKIMIIFLFNVQQNILYNTEYIRVNLIRLAYNYIFFASNSLYQYNQFKIKCLKKTNFLAYNELFYGFLFHKKKLWL